MSLYDIKNALRKNRTIFAIINFLALVVQIICRCLLRIVAIFVPVEQKRILFTAYEGRGYTCSPKYISQYIQQKGTHEIIWAFNHPENYVYLQEQGITVVNRKSLRYIYYFFSSKFIIRNDLMEVIFPTTRNQVYINTWHGGGAYKKWGFLVDWSWIGKIRYFLTHKFTYYLSSCEAFTRYATLAFNAEISQFINSGLPRNDLFFDEKKVKLSTFEILNKLDLDSEFRYALYAPTYREFKGSSTYNIDFSAVKTALEIRFGGNWKILFRGHYYLDNIKGLPDYIIDVSSHDDMQEILLISDVLITDYSSSIWDYALLKRPCFLYTPDKEEYESVTNYCTPLEEWPYSFALTNESLYENIVSFDERKYLDSVEKHQELLGIYEKGIACKMIFDLLQTK